MRIKTTSENLIFVSLLFSSNSLCLSSLDIGQLWYLRPLRRIVFRGVARRPQIPTATSHQKVKIVTIRAVIEDGARLDLSLSLEVLKTAAKIRAFSQITLDLDKE